MSKSPMLHKTTIHCTLHNIVAGSNLYTLGGGGHSHSMSGHIFRFSSLLPKLVESENAPKCQINGVPIGLLQG